jgi:hypothetical protein
MFLLAIGLAANSFSTAATLKGTVRNGTTGRPGSSQEVLVLSLGRDKTELGRGRTDSNGAFEFTVNSAQVPYLVRVFHQGIAYQSMAPPGVKSVDVQIYETSGTAKGMISAWRMQRLQTGEGQLQIIDEITVRNASAPPRTVITPDFLEFRLPLGAEVVAGKVQIGTEPPVIRNPRAGAVKGHYYFDVPLLPGDTRVAVAYRLAYRGEALIEPASLQSLEQFVVVLPKTMKFEPESANVFHPMPDKPGVQVYGSAAGTQGRPMTFRVLGKGRLPESERGQRARPDVTSRTGPPASTPSSVPSNFNLQRSFLVGLALVAAAIAAGFLSHRRKTIPAPEI